MEITDWRIYNHALIPTTPPHVEPNQQQLASISWVKNKIFFARWATDWDCGCQTEWWYCIKDTKLNLDELNAKKRYEIKKGIKNYNIAVIDPNNYKNELFEIFSAAYEEYPKVYRPILEEEKFKKEIEQLISSGYEFLGAFDRENEKICGVAIILTNEEYVEFSMLRVFPFCQKKGINAAIVSFIIDKYINSGLKRYINDGTRNIRHMTNFQDYLIKYFGFRKAYCRLIILYNPIVKLVVNALYHLLPVIKTVSSTSLTYNVACILEQERIRRTFD